MKIKKGVILAGLDIRMRPVLIAADAIWKSIGQELVVVCGLDDVHSAGSLHYYGLALDFRTRYFRSRKKKVEAAMELRKELGNSFQVVLEDTHIHVEYDY